MEDKLKKENEIADQNIFITNTLHDSSNELAEDVAKLSKQLKTIIQNLENFGTMHINLKDALKRAREILRQTKEISNRFKENEDLETFYHCSNITQKVNSIYKPPLNIPKQILKDLQSKLNDIINITAAVENICDLAEEKNLKNAEKIVRIKEKIEKN
ncbi:hypothetical protein NQ314_017787 [Rhamnusium bicolor]|uniref:Uncharacterized protein n=1 Tax=Rhamnusium bicolor TaxID=1586634 RepID=A0AAV8WS26_9CUCU|nr:hypothetical protein NQ314_017787 [Rhamnusium bicolor]